MKRNAAAILIIVLLTPVFTSADPLLEAQMLALDISGELLPPEELTQRILEDLAAIRAAYPEVTNIHYRPNYEPSQMLVSLTDEAFAQYLQGQYHAWDELNAAYGAIDFAASSFVKIVLLKFDKIYNMELLSDIYEQAHIDGIIHAQPNYLYGDGNTIYADPPRYTFRRAWGDCPAGCIYRKDWHFEVEDGQVTLFTTWYVNAATGDDTNYGLTEDEPLATIQKAIDLASNNETIVIAAGTYTGPGNRDIDFWGKAVTVRSTDPNDPNIVANTIISCEGSISEPHQGFIFANHEGLDSSLHGITITGSYHWDGGAIQIEGSSPTITRCRFVNNSALDGGAIRYHSAPGSPKPLIDSCLFEGNVARLSGGAICMGGAPTLTNCVFKNNYAHFRGGAILCGGSSSAPAIDSCLFENNAASQGGAISICNSSKPTLTNCVFRNNYAKRWGGAIEYIRSSEPAFVNCAFIANESTYDGGAIATEPGDFSSSLFMNCLFAGNSARRGGAICGDNDVLLNCTFADNRASIKGGCILGFDDCRTELTGCILWGNRDSGSNLESAQIAYLIGPYGSVPQLNYCCVEGWTGNLGGTDNMGLDPCSVKAGHWDPNGTPDELADDFFVMGNYNLFATSPCIDAGDPNYAAEPNETDIDGKPRIIGGRIDMGAYEYWPPVEAKMHFTPQTLDCKSSGRWVKAHITLPEGFSPEEVDLNTPAAAWPLDIESEYIKIISDSSGGAGLEIGFNRTEFCKMLTNYGSLEVVVTGLLQNGRGFTGSDTIKIIAPGRKR